MTITVAVSIVRWVDDEPQPGIVECKLTDRFGKDWAFIEKSAMVSPEVLVSGSRYPQPGVIGCRVISTGKDDEGREFSVIDTEQPWDIEAAGGETCFEVFNEQLGAM